MTFRVIEGSGGESDDPRRFVCTYCADGFPSRDKLEAHWSGNTRCRNNRFASSQTNSKYRMEDGTPFCTCGHLATHHDDDGAGRCRYCVACGGFKLRNY